MLTVSGGAKAAAKRCRTLPANGRLRTARLPKSGVCRPVTFLRATLKNGRWNYKLKRKLPRGAYVVYSRATDRGGRTQRTFTGRAGNRRAFKLG